jgi:FkbM family methyltransferase
MLVDSNQPAERWLLYSGNYQPALTHILRQHTPAGGYCLDIGANLGFYTLKFARWAGLAGQVVAFEANPAMVERIAQNVALNGYSHVNVVSAAVHNQPGSIEFYVSSSPGKSSVNQIDNAVKKITVPALTIDEFISERAWPRLDVVKIDIEGNDCNALLGACQTLDRFRPFVVFEYKRAVLPQIAQEAFGLLASLKYQLWSLSPGGKRLRFDWQSSVLAHSDIICTPMTSKTRNA